MGYRTLVAPFSFGRLRLHTDVGYRWGWSFKTPDKKLMWGYHSDRSRASEDARDAMKRMGINAATLELVKMSVEN